MARHRLIGAGLRVGQNLISRGGVVVTIGEGDVVDVSREHAAELSKSFTLKKLEPFPDDPDYVPPAERKVETTKVATENPDDADLEKSAILAIMNSSGCTERQARQALDDQRAAVRSNAAAAEIAGEKSKTTPDKSQFVDTKKK